MFSHHPRRAPRIVAPYWRKYTQAAGYVYPRVAGVGAAVGYLHGLATATEDCELWVDTPFKAVVGGVLGFVWPIALALVPPGVLTWAKWKCLDKKDREAARILYFW